MSVAAQSEAGGGDAHDRPVYRADIDGLRAVAIAAVIGFHYGLPLPGGYAGVDVFFVISGALIAGILLRTPPSPAGLLRFAERRVRRLLPALTVVLAASCGAALFMVPADLKTVGLGLMNAVAFTSNGYFATLADDYFAAGALAANPALHTWSLAVEAQFYLLAALVWWGARGRPRTTAAALAGLAVLSFGLSTWEVAARPAAAFYLLPSRFWEFAVGGALALPRLRAPARWAELATVCGLGLIGVSFATLAPGTPFPGPAATLPCLGAALAIASGGRNPVSRGLGLLARPGRLAYTLYLWHWPVLVFAGYGRAAPLPVVARLGLALLTAGLAVATTWLVERPFIARRVLPRSRPFLLASAAAAAAVAGAALVLNLAGQDVLRLRTLPADVLALSAARFDAVDLRCPATGARDAGCRFGSPDAPPTIALWGNSFARMWLPGLAATAGRRGTAGLAVTVVRCPPLLGASFAALPGCETANRDALAFLDAHPALRTIVIGGDWGAWPAALPALPDTVAALRARGRRVVVILAPPAIPFDVPRTLALAALRHRPPPPGPAAADVRGAMAGLAADLAARGIAVIDPVPAFCDGPVCAVQAEGRPLYYDDKHVTRFAAARAASLFDAAVAP